MKNIKQYVARTILTLVGVADGVCTYAMTAYATDVAEQVTSPMKSVINVLLTIMSVVGVFMLVKAVMNLVNSIQEQDNSGIYRAGTSIAVALLMISIKLVVQLFGVEL